MRRAAAGAALAAALSGCGLLGQVQALATFTKCQFRLESIGNTRLAGVPIQGRHAVRDLNALDAIRLAAALRGGTIPLAFSLNVEGRNPNPEVAAMAGMAWILLVDNREVTRGHVDQPVEIAPNGGVATIVVDLELDLRQVLSGESLDAVKNLAFNVAGEGAHSTRLTLKLKPSIMIVGRPMEFPDYLTVSTEFGGAAPPR